MSDQLWMAIKRMAVAVPLLLAGIMTIRYGLMFLVAMLIGG